MLQNANRNIQLGRQEDSRDVTNRSIIKDRVKCQKQIKTPNLGISSVSAPSKKHFLETNVICLCGLAIYINHVGSPAHAHRWRHNCHWSHWCRHGFHPIPARGHNSIPGYLCPWRYLAHSCYLLCTAEYQESTFCLACRSLFSLTSSSKTEPLY